MLSRILFCACLFVFSWQEILSQPAGRSGFKIDGRLIDSTTRQPIARARVAISPVTQRDSFTTMITGEDGLFSFAGLKAGKYTLSAQAYGYVFQAFNQHDQYASSIVVGENANSSGLIFRLDKENTIDGTITDEAGEPVRNAQITLYQTGIAGGSQGARARTHGSTNDLGNYHLGHLPAGDYIISVEAMVWYAQRTQHRVVYTFTDSSQRFSFSRNVFGGTAVGTNPASSQPETPNPLDVAYPLTFFPGVTEPGSAHIIHLTRGEKYVADLTLQPRPALHLKFPAAGPPESPASYRLERKMLDGATQGVMAEITNLPSGEVEIEGVAPGQYTLITELHRSAEPGSQKVASTDTTSARTINAVANDLIDEEKMMSFAAVKAKLLFEPGVAVANRSYLMLYDFKTRKNFFELIPADGEIEFKQTVPPGNYELSINGNGSSFIRSIMATGAKVYGRTVMIRGTVPVKLEITISKGQGQITGVALRDGQPLAGVMIVAVPSDPAHNQVLFRRDQSDSDGTFTLPNVVPGNYTLLAIENGWDLQWLKPEVLKPYLARGEAVQVQQNGKYELKLKAQ